MLRPRTLTHYNHNTIEEHEYFTSSVPWINRVLSLTWIHYTIKWPKCYTLARMAALGSRVFPGHARGFAGCYIRLVDHHEIASSCTFSSHLPAWRVIFNCCKWTRGYEVQPLPTGAAGCWTIRRSFGLTLAWVTRWKSHVRLTLEIVAVFRLGHHEGRTAVVNELMYVMW